MIQQTSKNSSTIFKLFICLIPTVLILFMLNYLMNDSSSVQAQAPQQLEIKIGPGIIESIQSQGKANVVIALADSSINIQVTNLEQAKRQIETIQTSVLSTVDSSEFIPSHQYQAVPAIAGNILTPAGLYKLAANEYVSRIDLDVGGTGSLATSVPLIGANTWHNANVKGNSVVVAVLDSGLDTDHSDLASALVHQECFLDNNGSIDGSGLCPNGSDRQSGNGSAEDDAGHGTHVTGIIASRGIKSAVGVAPGTNIVSIKVTAGPSFSGIFYSFSEIVAALDFIINNRPDVQVINMSLGTNAQFAGDCDNATSWTMAGASAINTLRSQGVIAFASAGNNGSGTLMGAPACLSNVLSVGATDNSDNIASFSDSNATTDIFAPGVSILASAMGNSTTTASGTSMASPHAAGCAALLIAAKEAITPDQIETRLETSPVQVFNPKNNLTFPRIDCSLKPIESVSVAGPTTGISNEGYVFTATVSPITATQPITYVWQATDQVMVINSGMSSNSEFFNWTDSGTKIITVTARNLAGAYTETHAITLITPIESMTINGPVLGVVDNDYSFSTAVHPISVTLPITYTWHATGLDPITNSGGITSEVSFNWDSLGPKQITVNAENSESSITYTHAITIYLTRVFLPLITK